ncbi:MAG: hypothetical protein JXD23_05290 [Spirochaetales bacterium]|nr:hypothetical protein [Spirochaetales bacterium]
MTANRSRPLAGGRIVLFIATALLVLAVVLLPVASAFFTTAFASVFFTLPLFFPARAPAAPLAAVRAAHSVRGPPLNS